MRKIHTVVIDDEYESRKTLIHFLCKYCPDIFIAGEAASVKEAIELIREQGPDLVFLDIDMPVENGFQLFAQLPEIRTFQTIFVTAYNEYALQAIKHQALDYILKPIDINELIISVDKVKQYKDNRFQADQLQQMMHEFKRMNERLKIALPTMEGFTYVFATDIIRCEASSNYTHIYLKNGDKIVSSKTLGLYEELLNEEGFFRVHHAHLVNMYFVKAYHKGRGGYIEMENGMTVEVSARRKESFLAKFK